MATTNASLTHRQRVALVALGDDVERNAEDLAAALGTSSGGAVRTAASLARRDLLERTGHRPARFKITTRGLDHLHTEQLELLDTTS